MTHWAFCEELASERVVVSDAEAHHLLHVLRCSVGDSLTLFDGRGTEAVAVIAAVSRRDVSCNILSRVVHVPKPAGITVYASPPKADRLKWMVEKLTEIGVDRLTLLNTKRTIVTPGETRLEKLQGSVIAACKQCRRPVLMELQPLQTFASVLQHIQSKGATAKSFIAHPGIQDRSTLNPGDSAPVAINLLIGPEGGFTDEEVQQALMTGVQPIAWPTTILRIETAAVVFASLLMSGSRLSSVRGHE